MTSRRPRKPNIILSEDDDKPLAERVASEIRKAFRAGHLRPGKRIREVEVADWLGVSRTPVREALHRLTDAGLLEQTAQGLLVVTLSQNDIIELYQVREVLVGAAASHAAQRASTEEIQHLKSIFEALEGQKEAAGLKALNDRFHRTLYDISHNSYLVKTLKTLINSHDMLSGSTLVLVDGSRRSLDEHRAIVDAIERRDSAEAEAVARAHIRNSLRIRLQVIDGR